MQGGFSVSVFVGDVLQHRAGLLVFIDPGINVSPGEPSITRQHSTALAALEKEGEEVNCCCLATGRSQFISQS